MGLRLYPYERERRERRDKSGRQWRVDYDLNYDGGSFGWSEYYRTKLGARIAAWWNYYIGSWGGTVVLVNQKEE